MHRKHVPASALALFYLQMMIFYAFFFGKYNLGLAIVFGFIKVLIYGKNRTP
jgi:hypothetical protein